MSKRRRFIEADRLFNRPWFLTRGAMVGLVDAHRAAITIGAFYEDDEGGSDFDDPPDYSMTADGIASINVGGVLTKNPCWMGTCYGDIADKVDHAMQNPAVKGILLCVDSPGGEASGMFDLADRIHGMRGQKPIAAIADDCFSAAYAVASAADKIFVTRTGGVGSIGCWTAHVDLSEMLAGQGVKITYVFSGERKIDGNETEPLSDRARGEMQDEVDRIRGMFADTVARNRGVSADVLLETEAGIFMGPAGVPLLADAVGSADDALDYLRECIGSNGSQGTRGAQSFFTHPGVSAERSIRNLYQSAVVDGKRWADHSFGKGSATLAVRCLPPMRASASSQVSNRKISMLVAPYDGSAANISGFKEVYQRGCFSRGLDNDPRVLFNHDEAYVLGRTSAGTCRFWEDAAGVHAEVDAPETNWANDLLVSLRRGDITQASAAFWVLQDRWEMRGSDRYRVIEKARMREASVHAFVAYENTTAAVSTTSASALDSHREKLRLIAATNPLTDLQRAELAVLRLR